jgi:hypothetical protein
VLASILSIQEERVAANDYTIRFRNRFYQLLKPVHPGERGGKVVIELRLDGSMAMRCRTPAEPYPPDGAGKNNGGKSRRPAENHPWRSGFKKAK